jgi:hypothetical protein
MESNHEIIPRDAEVFRHGCEGLILQGETPQEFGGGRQVRVSKMDPVYLTDKCTL